MKARGKVLRAPGSEPGLLMIEGRQFRFAREGIWRSAVPPRPGLSVEVNLDQDQQVASISVVPDPLLPSGDVAVAPGRGEESGSSATTRRIAQLAVPAMLAAILLLIVWLLS